MDELFVIVVAVFTVLFLVTTEYSLDIKKLYPSWVMDLISEPLVRFSLYVLVYVLACVNIHLSALLAIVVVLLHIDYINFTK
jgi:hypothetical protein